MVTRKLLIVLAFVLGLTGGVALARATSPFTDVPPGHYAEDAIAWAVENGITRGCAPDRFCPDQPVTRAQIVTFLHRYAKLTGEAPLVKPTAPTPGPTTTTTTVIGDETYYPPNASVDPAADGLQRLAKIRIAPENCDGYLPNAANYAEPPSLYRYRDEIGYLSHHIPANAVDFVVSPYEAWCSGVRNPSFTKDTYNLWWIAPPVDQAKGAHDPLEWWNTNDAASPQKVNYPGWCQYLVIHVAVKADSLWNASMDQAEYDFVKEQLGKCGPITN